MVQQQHQHVSCMWRQYSKPLQAITILDSGVLKS
jgi:hypothetical protein